MSAPTIGPTGTGRTHSAEEFNHVSRTGAANAQESQRSSVLDIVRIGDGEDTDQREDEAAQEINLDILPGEKNVHVAAEAGDFGIDIADVERRNVKIGATAWRSSAALTPRPRAMLSTTRGSSTSRLASSGFPSAATR